MKTTQLKVAKVLFLNSIIFLCFLLTIPLSGQSTSRTDINLNGTWDFDQTLNAFPPAKFTRTIPVPGLIHLAKPQIEDYDKFFKRPVAVEEKWTHNLYDIDYIPKYSWYRKQITIPAALSGQDAIISIRKSMFVTTVFVNGMEVGSSIACFTPVEFPVTQFLKPGQKNEILIRLGDRTWLPAQAAGGTDKEKEKYLPGIWDDVSLSFTGKIRVNKILLLPSVQNKKVTAKVLLRNFYPAQLGYGDPMTDTCDVNLTIKEWKTGIVIAKASTIAISKRDNESVIAVDIPLENFKKWTLDDPFLYQAEVKVNYQGRESDIVQKRFGMRDFEKRGKYFYLNGEKIILRGSNITLHRFFEDPDCNNLAWDKAWVTKLLGEIPKTVNWNAMRVCVGLLPDFWYDIADESGLLLQNEWMYWQNHGWDEQFRKEYTDWVWSDGCHPSIVIWDAINENTDAFIGNTLVPELKKLDNTRIWDNGYMVSENMTAKDDLDEPHLYMCVPWVSTQPGPRHKEFFELGRLDYWPSNYNSVIESGVPQLVNEYGWIWLWRNGIPSKLTVENYDYFLGKNATPEQRFEMQAYWMQLETEWVRNERSIAGVLAFAYLTNNYGYTGDWFMGNIKDLTPSPTLKWLKHAFAPAAVFINLTDQQYMKNQKPFKPGEEYAISLFGINELSTISEGKLELKLLDSKGNQVLNKSLPISIDPYGKKAISYTLKMPLQEDGYLLLSEYTPKGASDPVISRRYIKVGNEGATYSFFNIDQ
jgi:hypothetical protein